MGVSRTAVTTAVEAGELKAYRIGPGKLFRFDPDDVKAYLDAMVYKPGSDD